MRYIPVILLLEKETTRSLVPTLALLLTRGPAELPRYLPCGTLWHPFLHTFSYMIRYVIRYISRSIIPALVLVPRHLVRPEPGFHSLAAGPCQIACKPSSSPIHFSRNPGTFQTQEYHKHITYYPISRSNNKTNKKTDTKINKIQFGTPPSSNGIAMSEWQQGEQLVQTLVHNALQIGVLFLSICHFCR